MGNRRSSTVWAAGLAIGLLLVVWGSAPDAPPLAPLGAPASLDEDVRSTDADAHDSAPAPPPAFEPASPTRAASFVQGASGRDAPVVDAPGPRLPAWLRDALERTPGETKDLVTNRDGAVTRDSANSGDLRALSEIIAANGLHEGSSPFDYDDGDGIFEPWELGLQVWEAGDLVALSLGPDRSSTFGYGIRVLPESVGELRALRVLDLHGNALTEVPRALTDLSELRHLYVFRNRLSALPESLGDLASLEVLVAGRNRIEVLPRSLGDLSNLEQLLLGENPLAALPEGLGELRSLEVLDIARTRGSAGEEGFPNLPAILEALGALEEIHLTASEVGARPPDRLRDGSIARVYGWTRAPGR